MSGQIICIGLPTGRHTDRHVWTRFNRTNHGTNFSVEILDGFNNSLQMILLFNFFVCLMLCMDRI